MLRQAILMTLCVALGAAAAAVVVVRHRTEAELPPGWAEVVVLGRDDAPIEGVTLRWDGQPPCATTDARGVARLDLTGHGKSPVFAGGVLETGYHKIEAPRTVVRLPDAIPIDVSFVDARDGRTLVGGYVGWTKDRTNPMPSATDVAVHRLTSTGADFSGFPAVAAPTGFAAIESWSIGVALNRAVRRARVAIPVWPEGRVRLRVVDASGRPVAGRLLTSWKAAGQGAREREVFAGADGRVVMTGVPLVPHPALVVTANCYGRLGKTVVDVRPDVFDYEAVIALPERLNAGDVRATCGGSGGFGPGFEDLPAGGDSTLRLRVLRRDGTPARRARVVIRATAPQTNADRYSGWRTDVRTDEDGRASRSDLWIPRSSEAQVVTVVLSEPGLAYTTFNVPLTPGGTVDCELRESEGRSIELTVVDAAGRRVPWAQVSASQSDDDWVWSLVEGEAQDFAPRTDLEGRIVLHGLPPGEVQVAARFGHLDAATTVTSGDSATLTLY